jgi:hypothetical protein
VGGAQRLRGGGVVALGARHGRVGAMAEEEVHERLVAQLRGDVQRRLRRLRAGEQGSAGTAALRITHRVERKSSHDAAERVAYIL